MSLLLIYKTVLAPGYQHMAVANIVVLPWWTLSRYLCLPHQILSGHSSFILRASIH